MHKTVKPALLTAVAAAALTSGSALAELSANIGVTSNYVWRGLSQSDDGPAISGGIDYEHASGLYVGTWTSSVGDWGNEQAGDGYELDGYFGFAGTAGPLGYDLGFIYYAYPLNTELDFYEVYGLVSYDFVELGLAYDPDNEDSYVSAAVGLELPQGLGLGLLAGRYLLDADDDYNHYQLSLSRGDFVLAVDYADLDGFDDPRVSASWSKAF